MRRFFSASVTTLFVMTMTASAFADKVVVLPFSAPKGLAAKPELNRARQWARDAVTLRGHVLPSEGEVVRAEATVTDGTPDTSQEYLTAGRAAGAQWTVTGQVDRHDSLPAKLPDGTLEEPFTTYRIELEVAQVDTGRVESLAREVDPDEGTAQIAEMLALLVRPEGIRNAKLPWDNAAPAKRKVKALPPPVVEPPPIESKPPLPSPGYAEGYPAILGVSVGYSGALERPGAARGPSSAMPIGAAVGYAIEQVPGVELRGILTSQVLGPKALEIAAGARYAFPLAPRVRLFVGPELLVGAHVAIGAEKTARLLGHGAAFVAWGLGERVQVEAALDLATALGGTGTLILGGATCRALVRF